MNNDAIDDRRQLLVKVSSLIKSWRISRDNLNTGYSGDENDENVKPLRRGRRKQKRKLSVMFDDELSAVPSYYDGPMSCQEIEDRWYETKDYDRFKKDAVLTSLNYINARRASKSFDQVRNCIWGIEERCLVDQAVIKRRATEKKHVYKAIRDEQSRQKKERRRNLANGEVFTKPNSSSSTANMEKIRSACMCYTKGARDRAVARGNQYARERPRRPGVGRNISFSSQRRPGVSRSRSSTSSRQLPRQGVRRTSSSSASVKALFLSTLRTPEVVSEGKWSGDQQTNGIEPDENRVSSACYKMWKVVRIGKRILFVKSYLLKAWSPITVLIGTNHWWWVDWSLSLRESCLLSTPEHDDPSIPPDTKTRIALGIDCYYAISGKGGLQPEWNKASPKKSFATRCWTDRKSVM